MNFTDFVKNPIFTDANLTLVDPNKTITLPVHRFLLASASLYFRNLFTFGSNLDKTDFTVNVNDVDIWHDLIMSWYGHNVNSGNYPPWLHLLKTFESKSFLCLDLDQTLLYDLVVPPEGFEFLVKIMDLFDYTNNKRLLRTIKKNVPDNYELSSFDADFVKL